MPKKYSKHDPRYIRSGSFYACQSNNWLGCRGQKGCRKIHSGEKRKRCKKKRTIKLNIDGDVSSGGGDVASFIYKQGLDVSELISALKRAFPENDPRPEQFRVVLEQFHAHHNSLYEWKELHNALDDVLSSFGQFYSAIQKADAEKVMPRIDSLRSLWRAVSVSVDNLVDFASEIEFIGDSYSESLDGKMLGEPWVVKINALRRQIDTQLGVGIVPISGIPSSVADRFIQRSKFRIGIRSNWWLALLELTNEFNHTAYAHMHLADKKLRDSANELYILSKSVFGS